MRSLALHLLPLLLLAATLTTSGADDISPPSLPTPAGYPEVPPGWELIRNMQDPFYSQVGKFAVAVYCLWNDIKPVPPLDGVVSGCTQQAGDRGVDYLLVVRVRGLGSYRALVWGVPETDSQNWKLMSFEPAQDEKLHL